MELVFELRNANQFVATHLCRKTFNQAGGVIGREADCDWSLPDNEKRLSRHHALISYRDGAFFLTDISSNGTQVRTSGAYLRHGEATQIEHGSVYQLGDYELQARLVRAHGADEQQVGIAQAANTIIPEDALIELDPLFVLDQQADFYADIEALISPGLTTDDGDQHADYARIDRECLMVPTLVEAPKAPLPMAAPPRADHQPEGFWAQFSEALGLDLHGLDQEGKEAVAVNAACLLKHSIGGLQQSLRTRSELKNELRLAQTVVQGTQKNPLKFSADTAQALENLLQPGKPGQLPAEQAVTQAFRDLQAHQVALLTATRTAVRSTLEHFSPQQLTLRFERDNKPLLATSGRRWRAYERYHHALCQDDDWSQRLLARDFAQAYEEQLRLISTLYTDHQG